MYGKHKTEKMLLEKEETDANHTNAKSTTELYEAEYKSCKKIVQMVIKKDIISDNRANVKALYAAARLK